MRMMLTVSALLLLISGSSLAGSGYDSCIKEEKDLKTRETGECRGLRYLLNPSACFATQKKLKEYTTTDRCRKIGVAEKVDFNAATVVPEKKFSSVSTASNAGSVGIISKPGVISPITVIKAEPAVPQQVSTCEELKDENARLKAEINRLTTELEGYTKACR